METRSTRHHAGRPWGAVDRNLARWRREQARLERERRPETDNRRHGRAPYRRERIAITLED